MKIDDKFRSLMASLSDDERAKLEESLKRDGCRDALVVWQETGILLDGHNRYEICEKNGIKHETVEMSFPDEGAAKAWLIQNQLARRNLAPFRRTEMVLMLEGLYAAEAKKMRVQGGKVGGTLAGRGRRKQGDRVVPTLTQPSDDRRTRTKLAKAANVSTGTMAKAKVLAARADESTKEMLRRGETTINEAYETVTGKRRKVGTEKPVERGVVSDAGTAVANEHFFAAMERMLGRPSLVTARRYPGPDGKAAVVVTCGDPGGRLRIRTALSEKMVDLESAEQADALAAELRSGLKAMVLSDVAQ